MEKPYVTEVRASLDPVTAGPYWEVMTSDQRKWYVARDKYPDEMAAYMQVTYYLKLEEEHDAYQRHPYPG